MADHLLFIKNPGFFLRPVDLHMQQPPRGGIWVGITCDLSKSNYELPNSYYYDSIIFDNTVQVIPSEWLHISVHLNKERLQYTLLYVEYPAYMCEKIHISYSSYLTNLENN
ncbi:hypothetical protein V1477_020701 [Vespula maculifrons]|uniref:Uncharacterized protein n=1 Tax=Vespula maculifrons TaxID=7453 RepID=A0ABD2AN88_VESMC